MRMCDGCTQHSAIVFYTLLLLPWLDLRVRHPWLESQGLTLRLYLKTVIRLAICILDFHFLPWL